jgi:hypothetical protein
MEPRHLEEEAEERTAERTEKATGDPRGEEPEEGGELEHRTPPEDDETWI